MRCYSWEGLLPMISNDSCKVCLLLPARTVAEVEVLCAQRHEYSTSKQSFDLGRGFDGFHGMIFLLFMCFLNRQKVRAGEKHKTEADLEFSPC